MALLAAAFLALLAGGCTPAYLVQVNGFADPAGAGRMRPGAKVHVASNLQAENPLLDREVGSKIEKLLQGRGFSLSDLERADYVCSFNYGLGVGLGKIDVIPIPHRPPAYPSRGLMEGGAAEPPTILLPGSTAYYPYARMDYDRWLKVVISDAASLREGRGEKILWYGDVVSSGASRDLRTALGYLLVAAFEELGEDTRQGLVKSIRVDDERLRIFTGE
jgi:hypothetical protein